MKRILTGLVAAVLLFGSVLALSSCGAKPELDFDAAKAKLEEKGYTVVIVTNKDLLELTEEKTVSATKVDGEGLEVKTHTFRAVTYKDSAIAKLEYESIKMQFDSIVASLELSIKTYKKTIEKYESEMTSDELDEMKEDLKDCEEELAEYKAYCFGRSGKTVWMASSEDVVKATKGK